MTNSKPDNGDGVPFATLVSERDQSNPSSNVWIWILVSVIGFLCLAAAFFTVAIFFVVRTIDIASVADQEIVVEEIEQKTVAPRPLEELESERPPASEAAIAEALSMVKSANKVIRSRGLKYFGNRSNFNFERRSEVCMSLVQVPQGEKEISREALTALEIWMQPEAIPVIGQQLKNGTNSSSKPLLVSLLANTGDVKAAPYLMSVIDSYDLWQEAVKGLQLIESPAIPYVLPEYNSANSSVQHRARTLLKYLRAEKHIVAQILNDLKSDDSKTAEVAAKSLLETPLSEDREVQSAIAEAIEGVVVQSDIKLRNDDVRKLFKLLVKCPRDPETPRALLEALRLHRSDSWMVRQILTGLKKLAPNSEVAVDGLIDILTEERTRNGQRDYLTSNAILDALDGTGSVTVAKKLFVLIETDHPNIGLNEKSRLARMIVGISKSDRSIFEICCKLTSSEESNLLLAGASALSKFDVNLAWKSEVIAVVEKARLRKLSSSRKRMLDKVAARWGDPKSVDALVDAVKSKHTRTATSAIRDLGALKNPSTYPIIIVAAMNPNRHEEAKKALIEIGPPAEEFIISELLGPVTRNSQALLLIQVLQELGGKQSLKALKIMPNSKLGKDSLVNPAIATAIEKIEKRLASVKPAATPRVHKGGSDSKVNPPARGNVLVAHPAGIDELSNKDLTKIQRIDWPDTGGQRWQVTGLAHDGASKMYALFVQEDFVARIGCFDFENKTWEFPDWCQHDITPSRSEPRTKLSITGDNLLFSYQDKSVSKNYQIRQLNLSSKKWYRLNSGEVVYGDTESVFIFNRAKLAVSEIDLGDGSVVSKETLSGKQLGYTFDDGRLTSMKPIVGDVDHLWQIKHITNQHRRKHLERWRVTEGVCSCDYRQITPTLLGTDRVLFSLPMGGRIATVNRQLDKTSVKVLTNNVDFYGPFCVVPEKRSETQEAPAGQRKSIDDTPIDKGSTNQPSRSGRTSKIPIGTFSVRNTKAHFVSVANPPAQPVRQAHSHHRFVAVQLKGNDVDRTLTGFALDQNTVILPSFNLGNFDRLNVLRSKRSNSADRWKVQPDIFGESEPVVDVKNVYYFSAITVLKTAKQLDVDRIPFGKPAELKRGTAVRVLTVPRFLDYLKEPPEIRESVAIIDSVAPKKNGGIPKFSVNAEIPRSSIAIIESENGDVLGVSLKGQKNCDPLKNLIDLETPFVVGHLCISKRQEAKNGDVLTGTMFVAASSFPENPKLLLKSLGSKPRDLLLDRIRPTTKSPEKILNVSVALEKLNEDDIELLRHAGSRIDGLELRRARLRIPIDRDDAGLTISASLIGTGGDDTSPQLSFHTDCKPLSTLLEPILHWDKTWVNPLKAYSAPQKIKITDQLSAACSSVLGMDQNKFPRVTRRKLDAAQISSNWKYQYPIVKPSFVFSEDESTCWMRTLDGFVRRFQMPELKLTDQVLCPGRSLLESRSVPLRIGTSLAMTLAGLVALDKNGLVVLDEKNLKQQRFIPIDHGFDIAGHPDSPLVYVLSFDFFRIVDVSTGRVAHTMVPGFSTKTSDAKINDRFSFRNAATPISSIQVSPDGKYLFMCSNHLARYRIDGSDLFFEARTPTYWQTGRPQSAWVSADSKLVAYNSPSITNPVVMKNLYGEAKLDPNIGGNAVDIYRVDDLSKPRHKIPFPKIDYSNRGAELRATLAYDNSKGKFLTKKDFGSFKSIYHARYLPKTNRVFLHGLPEDSPYEMLTVRDLGAGDVKTPKKSPPTVGSPFLSFFLKKNGLQKGNWNEAIFKFTQVSDGTVTPVWSADGKHLFTIKSDGFLRKINAENPTESLQSEFRLKAQAELNGKAFGENSILANTSEGLVVVAQDTQELILVDPDNLKVKSRQKLDLIQGLMGSPQHEFIVCALVDGETILYSLKDSEIKQRLRLDEPKLMEHKLPNTFAKATGFVSPFTRDGKQIFSEQHRYDLIGDQLVKNEKSLLDGKPSNVPGPSWRFYPSGFCRLASKLYRIEDLTTALMTTERSEVPIFYLEKSGLGFSHRESKTRVFNRDGKFKYEINLGKDVSIPNGNHDYFLASKRFLVRVVSREPLKQ